MALNKISQPLLTSEKSRWLAASTTLSLDIYILSTTLFDSGWFFFVRTVHTCTLWLTLLCSSQCSFREPRVSYWPFPSNLSQRVVPTPAQLAGTRMSTVDRKTVYYTLLTLHCSTHCTSTLYTVLLDVQLMSALGVGAQPVPLALDYSVHCKGIAGYCTPSLFASTITPRQEAAALNNRPIDGHKEPDQESQRMPFKAKGKKQVSRQV